MTIFTPLKNHFEIKTGPLKMVEDVFRAINHKQRQEIVYFIESRGKVSVTELYSKLGMEQSVASLHLGILRRAGIVHAERKGRTILYAVDYNCIERLNRFAMDLNKE